MSALLIIGVYKVLIIILTFGLRWQNQRRGDKVNQNSCVVHRTPLWFRLNIWSLSSPVYFNKVLLVFKTRILARWASLYGEISAGVARGSFIWIGTNCCGFGNVLPPAEGPALNVALCGNWVLQQVASDVLDVQIWGPHVCGVINNC